MYFLIIVFLQVHVSRCTNDLVIKVKLNSLKIRDELQGSISSHSKYLACSVIDQNLHSLPDYLELEGKDHFNMTLEEDDIFKDALPDFATLHDSAETGILEKNLSRGKINPPDAFYEAMSADGCDFVSVTFLTRNASSPDYDGIDTQVILSVGTVRET